MDDKRYDEHEIERMLKKAPKITDNRSKEEVFQQLFNDPRIHQKDAIKVNPTHQKKKWRPILVSLIAMVLMIFFMTELLNTPTNKQTMNSTQEKNVLTNQLTSENGIQSDTANDEAAKKVTEESLMINTIHKSSLYADEVGDNVVFQIGLASPDATSLPVTFVIPRTQILADFGQVKPSSYDLYMKYASQIDEEALGFVDYHPYKGKLEVKGDQILFTMPAEHPYDIASAAVSTFRNTLQDSFYGFKEIVFLDSNGENYTFSQEGVPSKPIQLHAFTNNHYAYFVYKNHTNGNAYLTPNFHVRYDSVVDALKAMAITDNDIFDSAIPSNVKYDISEEGNQVIIHFQQSLDLNKFKARQSMQMIEAMALTATSFQKQIILRNMVQQSWEGFNFNQPLPTPIGPNKIEGFISFKTNKKTRN